ncbi:hypothetical protein [Shewanella zhangzhouensis]|uniref:hypothetical protein n=1 Tax=Shewanella zhangzhouensis TaxID=2864213 RepID=UPI001C65B9F1|nr:hypothetical protein [Shewanella zhangzhouensis]QYK05228.1 hypothetical protein K0H63_19650 [Shewanella zhangzhouensis]
MNKTQITLAIAAILGIVGALTLLSPSPTTLEPGKTKALESGRDAPGDTADTIAEANRQTQLLTFEDSPLETSLSAVECLRAAGLGANADYKQQQQRTLMAWQLYQQGEPLLDIADALAVDDFDKGRDFYRFVKLREAVLTAESFLSQSEPGREVLKTANSVFQLPATSDLADNLSAMESGIGRLWKTQFPDLWNRAPDKGDIDVYISQIRGASVPSEILENRYLSPIPRFYLASLKVGDLTSATTLLDTFPSLLQSDAAYENQLMYNTLIGLHLEITETLVRTEAFTRFWEKLPQAQPVVLSSASKMRRGGRAIRTVKILEEQGFSVHVAYTDSYDVTARQDLLQQLGNIGSTLDEDTRARLKQCEQQQAWFDARRFNPEKLAQYRDSPFMDKVKNSPEIRYCAEKIWSSDTSLPSQMNELIAPLRDAMQQTPDWQQYPVGTLLAQASSEEDRSYMVLLSNTFLALNFNMPGLEVAQWLKQQGAQPDRKTLLAMLGQLDSTAWLFWANDMAWTDKEIKAIALAAAQIGEPRVYESISGSHPNLEWQDDELDPLYFAIKSFSSGSFTMFGVEIDRERVMNALEQNPGGLKEHHLRALFELQHRKPTAYEELINLYPRFTLSTAPEYFAVSCDSGKRAEG